MNTLVIPTNGPERLVAFLDAWHPWPWDRIVVVEDSPAITFELPARFAAQGDRVQVFSWAEIDALLPEPWIISRMDSAVRAFGFWKAWTDGAQTIFTVDDDCYPLDPDFVGEHRRNLEATPAWQSTIPGMRLRGLPYRNLGTLTDTVVSVGLWTHTPDVDAIHALAGAPHLGDGELTRIATRVMPAAQYFPMSGMNVAVRREVACLMYYPLMGRDSPFGRFDDIWCGLAVQRICRHLGLAITCGRPLVEHQRASDPFVNLVKEAPGISVNEWLWEVVDAVELRARDPLACMRELGAGLAAYRGREEEYVRRWGVAIGAWCALFESRP